MNSSSDFTKEQLQSEYEVPPEHKDETETLVKDPAKDKFDFELAERLTRKNLELIELRIQLARADAQRTLLLELFVVVLALLVWSSLYRKLD